MAEISSLPPPSIIAPLDYETALAERKAKLTELHPPVAPVLALESATTTKLLQENSYRELLLRGMVNDAFHQSLLAYASGPNLDHIAYFYDVTRLSGESDDRLRVRTILAIQGRSTGGTAPRYRAIAMGADVMVADAVVYRDGYDPTVRVAVYSSEVGGIAGPALVAKVQAALDAPAVRMVNDVIVVQAAVFQSVDVSIDAWLLPDADGTQSASIADALRASWANETGLGFDLTRSWITARAMTPGVQRISVTSPAADVIAPPYRAISLGQITVNIRGRDY